MKPARFFLTLLAAVPVCAVLSACGPKSTGATTATTAGSPVPAVAAAPAPAFVNYTCQVVDRYPHDPQAFTQGLVFLDAETLIESTGLNGRSSLRRVALKTGKVLQQVDLPDRFFGEGLALLKGRLYQLTWKDRKGFIYDAATFQKTGEFSYTGEGWGLTTDGTSLILSDGTDLLRFLDPVTFACARTVRVTHQGKPVDHLNELEYVNGQILANIWGADVIARIDPTTGMATAVIDCTSVFPAGLRSSPDQVLNGIAWDEPTQRLLITGKWWPTVFEVKLVAN